MFNKYCLTMPSKNQFANGSIYLKKKTILFTVLLYIYVRSYNKIKALIRAHNTMLYETMKFIQDYTNVHFEQRILLSTRMMHIFGKWCRFINFWFIWAKIRVLYLISSSMLDIAPQNASRLCELNL